MAASAPTDHIHDRNKLSLAQRTHEISEHIALQDMAAKINKYIDVEPWDMFLNFMKPPPALSRWRYTIPYVFIEQ